MLKQILMATGAALVALPALAQDAPDRDTVVATVNGTEITLGELIAATARLPPDYQALPAEFLFEGMVAQLIQQQLLADTVDEAPARVAITLANEERSLLAGEAVTDFLDAAVTDEAVQAAYDERYNAETTPQEFNAAHILVETEEEAQAILDRVNGGEDFGELARELSTDPGSGIGGGELGWFVPEMMVEPFGSTVAGLEPGALAGPVETQFGWHIIRLNDTRQQQLPPLELVRPEIEGELQQVAIEAHLAELEAGAEVTRPEPGAFDPAIITQIDLLAD